MPSLVIYFSGKVHNAQETLQLLEVHVGRLCRGYEASSKVCGLLLEDSVALVCIQSSSVHETLLSSPFVQLSNGLECIFKPASAYPSNLVDIALVDSNSFALPDFDSLLSTLTTTYATHICRVFKARNRAIVVFSAYDMAKLGVHFAQSYAAQQHFDAHSIAATLVDLDAILASPAVLNNLSLLGSRNVQVDADQLNASLTAPLGGWEGGRCPVVLAVSPCYWSGASESQSVLVLTSSTQDAANLRSTQIVELGPGVSMVFQSPAGPPGLQLLSPSGTTSGDRSRAPSLPTPMVSSVLVVWDTRFCTVPSQSLQASATQVSSSVQTLLQNVLFRQDPRAFITKQIAIVDTTHMEHFLSSLGEFIVTPSSSSQEAEGIVHGLIESHVSTNGSRSVVVLASIVDFILAVSRPYINAFECSLLALYSPYSDYQLVKSLSIPSFPWTQVVVENGGTGYHDPPYASMLAHPHPPPPVAEGLAPQSQEWMSSSALWERTRPSLGFDLTSTASTTTSVPPPPPPSTAMASLTDAETPSSHLLGGDTKFRDSPSSSPALGGLYTRSSLPFDANPPPPPPSSTPTHFHENRNGGNLSSNAFLLDNSAPPLHSGSGPHPFLALHSRGTTNSHPTIDPLSSFEQESKLELWTYTIALLFEKLLAWGVDEKESSLFPRDLDYLRGENISDYDHSLEGKCTVLITIDTAMSGYTLTLRSRSPSMLAKRSQRIANMIEEVKSTREMFQLLDWTPHHRNALAGSEVLKQQEKNCCASAYFSFNSMQAMVEIVALSSSHQQALSTFLLGLRPESMSYRLHKSCTNQVHTGLIGQLHRSYACYVQWMSASEEEGGGLVESATMVLSVHGFGPMLLNQALAYLPIHNDVTSCSSNGGVDMRSTANSALLDTFEMNRSLLTASSPASTSRYGEYGAHSSLSLPGAPSSANHAVNDPPLSMHTAHGEVPPPSLGSPQVATMRGMAMENREVICKIHRGTYSFADREAGIFFFAFESYFREYLEKAFSVIVEDSDFSVKNSKSLPPGVSPSNSSSGVTSDIYGYGSTHSRGGSSSEAAHEMDPSLSHSAAAAADMLNKNIVLKISFYGNHMKNVSAARSYLEQLNTTSLARIQLFFPQVTTKKYKEIYTRKATQCTYLNSLRIRDLHEQNASDLSPAMIDPLQNKAFINIRVKPPMHNHGIRRMGLPADVTVTICGSILCEQNIALMKELEEQFNAIASEYLVAEVKIPYSHPMKRNLTIKSLREELIRKFSLVALKWEEGSRATGSVGTAKIWASTQESLSALLGDIKAAEMELERAGIYSQPFSSFPVQGSGSGGDVGQSAVAALGQAVAVSGSSASSDATGPAMLTILSPPSAMGEGSGEASYGVESGVSVLSYPNSGMALLPAGNATHTINSTLDQLVEQFHNLNKSSENSAGVFPNYSGGAGSAATGASVGAGGVGGNGEKAVKDVKSIIYLPDLTLRYVLLAPPLNKQLNEMLVMFANQNVKIKYPFRDRNDPHAALLIEGEPGLIHHATATINDLITKSVKSLQSAYLLLSEEQHKLLVNNDLAGVKYIQGQAGVHLKLEPAHYELNKAMCVYDMRLFYKPRVSPTSGPTNAMLLATAPPDEDEEILTVCLRRSQDSLAALEVSVLQANCPVEKYLSAVQGIVYFPHHESADGPPSPSTAPSEGNEDKEAPYVHPHWQKMVFPVPFPSSLVAMHVDAPFEMKSASWMEVITHILEKAIQLQLQVIALWLPRAVVNQMPDSDEAAPSTGSSDLIARACVDAVLNLAFTSNSTLQRVLLIDYDKEVVVRSLLLKEKVSPILAEDSPPREEDQEVSTTRKEEQDLGEASSFTSMPTASDAENSSESSGLSSGEASGVAQPLLQESPEGDADKAPSPTGLLSDGKNALSVLSPDSHPASVRRLLQHLEWQSSSASSLPPSSISSSSFYSSTPPYHYPGSGVSPLGGGGAGIQQKNGQRGSSIYSMRILTCNISLPISALTSYLATSPTPSIHDQGVKYKALLLKGLPHGIVLAVDLINVVSQQRQPQLFLVKTAAPAPINTITSATSSIASSTVSSSTVTTANTPVALVPSSHAASSLSGSSWEGGGGSAFPTAATTHPASNPYYAQHNASHLGSNSVNGPGDPTIESFHTGKAEYGVVGSGGMKSYRSSSPSSSYHSSPMPMGGAGNARGVMNRNFSQGYRQNGLPGEISREGPQRHQADAFYSRPGGQMMRGSAVNRTEVHPRYDKFSASGSQSGPGGDGLSNPYHSGGHAFLGSRTGGNPSAQSVGETYRRPAEYSWRNELLSSMEANSAPGLIHGSRGRYPDSFPSQSIPQGMAQAGYHVQAPAGNAPPYRYPGPPYANQQSQRANAMAAAQANNEVYGSYHGGHYQPSGNRRF